MKLFFVLLFSSCSLISFCQEKSEAVKRYDLGVTYFKVGKFLEADSIFASSLELEPNPDTYYNRAIVNKKIENFTEYCKNLEYAKWYGDNDAGKLFNSDCNNIDSFYVTQDYKKADDKNYFYKLKFIKSKFSSQQEFYRYDNKNKLDLAYEIYNNDTAYTMLPKQKIDSVVDYIMKPIYNIINNNLEYPKEEKKIGVMGTVYVQFYINKKGYVETPRILRAPVQGASLATEALRVVSLFPHYAPIIYNGKPIKIKFTLPIKFTLK